jgi:hypothetical protein
MMDSVVLLADFEVVRNMGHRFQGKNAQLHLNDLFMFLAIVLAVAVAAWFLTRVARRERHRRTNSPRGLFLELCQAHELDRQSRKLLWRLATHGELSHPACLFLDPRRLDPGQLPDLLPSQLQRLANLREQLFSEGPEEVKSPAATATGTAAIGTAGEVKSAGAAAQ